MDFQRRTQVLQRHLPRPSVVDVDSLVENASKVSDTPEGAIAKEMALLITNDAFKYPSPGTKVIGSSRPLEVFDDDSLNRARLEIALEMPSDGGEERQRSFVEAWTKIHDSSPLPGLASYVDDENEKQKVLTRAFDVSLCKLPLSHSFSLTHGVQKSLQTSVLEDAQTGNSLEKKLALHYGGYQQRANTLRQKIVEAAEALELERIKLDVFRTLQIAEEAALPRRLERLGEEVRFVKGREREAQEGFRMAMEELVVNGLVS